MKNTQSSTFLSADEELLLVRKAQSRNDHAMLKIVENFKGLIYKEARAISKRDDEVEELFLEGREALLAAVISYDPQSGNRLSSYVGAAIRNAVRNFKQEHLSSPFRLPHDAAVSCGKVKKYIRQWQSRMETTEELPDAYEVAEALGMKTSTVRSIMEACYQSVSLNDERGEDTPVFQLADSCSSDSRMNLSGLYATIERLISRFSLRDQKVFRLMSPAFSAKEYSREDVAQMLGLTPQRISQIYKEMLCTLKADPEMQLYRAIA